MMMVTIRQFVARYALERFSPWNFPGLYSVLEKTSRFNSLRIGGISVIFSYSDSISFFGFFGKLITTILFPARVCILSLSHDVAFHEKGTCG